MPELVDPQVEVVCVGLRDHQPQDAGVSVMATRKRKLQEAEHAGEA